MKRAVLYIRTSKTTQCPENQLPQLEQFCKDKGLTIVRVYAEQESAWVKGHQHEWKLLMTAAPHGHFDAVVIWSLDRMCREGVGEIFSRIKTLNNYGIEVLSFQEQWLQGMAAMADLFISLLGWVAWFESDRRSQRTKAGIAQKRLHGGGKRGPDKTKRKTRVIKRPTNFTSDSYAWPENL
jgi:DNA invertase Pin-like site-specific DNA recombinase